MPSRSESQRRALFAKFGEAWVREHHFDKVVARPDPKPKPKAKKRGRGKP